VVVLEYVKVHAYKRASKHANLPALTIANGIVLRIVVMVAHRVAKMPALHAHLAQDHAQDEQPGKLVVLTQDAHRHANTTAIRIVLVWRVVQFVEQNQKELVKPIVA